MSVEIVNDISAVNVTNNTNILTIQDKDANLVTLSTHFINVVQNQIIKINTIGFNGASISDGAGVETFESVSGNAKSYPYQLIYTGSTLTSINYITPTGTITKTLNRTNGKVSSVVLSGAIPVGINTIKTIPSDLTIAPITYS